MATKNCRACLEPQHCDCLCRTCVQARLRMNNVYREEGYRDAHAQWEVRCETPERREVRNDYDKGWNAFIDELESDSEPEPEPKPTRKMTRTERLQAAADAGVDTWEDYRGEK